MGNKSKQTIIKYKIKLGYIIMGSPVPFSCPKSPPRCLVHLPATPGSHLKADTGPIFDGDCCPLNPIEDKLQSLHFPHNINTKGFYTPPGGNQELCAQQPDYSLSCGVGSMLMMLSHFLFNYKDDLGPLLALKTNFWDWYSNSSFLNQKPLMEAILTKTNFTDHGLAVKGEYFNDILEYIDRHDGIDYTQITNFAEDILSRLKSIQTRCQSPMIVSITNPKINGHWIVIDHINDSEVWIRDPYTGLPFKLSIEEMYKNWEEEDEVKVVYLERVSLDLKTSDKSKRKDHSNGQHHEAKKARA